MVEAISSDTGSRRPPPDRQTLWKILGIFFVAMLVMTFVRPLDWLRRPGTEDPAVGASLAWLELSPLDESAAPVQLADLRGQVTLVNFWGTWCGPCRREFPELVELARRWNSRSDVRVLAVSCGYDGASDATDQLRPETWRYLEANEAIDLPTYVDPGSFTRQAVADAVGMSGYPLTLVMDRDGVIRGIWRGYTSTSVRQMEQLIGELLDAQSEA